jgi:ADP-heptose:LPS heptosyltransferase
MGDVALTVPVIAALRKQYLDLEIVIMTQKTFRPFFVSVPSLEFYFPEFTSRHKGLPGLVRLFLDLRKSVNPDIIIDLHDVLRSKVIGGLFKLTGTPVYRIDKGRREKKSLITGKKKVFLKHTVERYADVLRNAGYSIDPQKQRCIVPKHEELDAVEPLLSPGILNIGVAPFAKHDLKMWPLEYMKELLLLISEHSKCRFFLFGGKEDSDKMEQFRVMFPGIVPVSGKPGLSHELALISRLDFMITMDSSNMHMAALCGTRVISIWGGTDPMAGFGPWMQPDSHSVRIPVEELDCRPCTIYGKGKTRNGFDCMRRLKPEIVFNRMKSLGVLNKE